MTLRLINKGEVFTNISNHPYLAKYTTYPSLAVVSKKSENFTATLLTTGEVFITKDFLNGFYQYIDQEIRLPLGEVIIDIMISGYQVICLLSDGSMIWWKVDIGSHYSMTNVMASRLVMDSAVETSNGEIRSHLTWRLQEDKVIAILFTSGIYCVYNDGGIIIPRKDIELPPTVKAIHHSETMFLSLTPKGDLVSISGERVNTLISNVLDFSFSNDLYVATKDHRILMSFSENNSFASFIEINL